LLRNGSCAMSSFSFETGVGSDSGKIGMNTKFLPQLSMHTPVLDLSDVVQQPSVAVYTLASLLHVPWVQ
jgi:hypothetical protein